MVACGVRRTGERQRKVPLFVLTETGRGRRALRGGDATEKFILPDKARLGKDGGLGEGNPFAR